MAITPTISTLSGVPIAHAQMLVLGGGVTGRSVAQVLSNMGAEVSIYDENESSTFDFPRVTVNELANTNWAAAVVSPGWRPVHPVIADLRNREIPLLNEIDIAWEIKQQVAPEQKWLAITGTNGKTRRRRGGLRHGLPEGALPERSPAQPVRDARPHASALRAARGARCVRESAASAARAAHAADGLNPFSATLLQTRHPV